MQLPRTIAVGTVAVLLVAAGAFGGLGTVAAQAAEDTTAVTTATETPGFGPLVALLAPLGVAFTRPEP